MISEHRKKLMMDIVLFLYSQSKPVTFNELHRRFYRRFKHGKTELDDILRVLMNSGNGIIIDLQVKGKLEYLAHKEHAIMWIAKQHRSEYTTPEPEILVKENRTKIDVDGISAAFRPIETEEEKEEEKEEREQPANVLGLKPTEIPDFEGEI